MSGPKQIINAYTTRVWCIYWPMRVCAWLTFGQQILIQHYWVCTRACNETHTVLKHIHNHFVYCFPLSIGLGPPRRSARPSARPHLRLAQMVHTACLACACLACAASHSLHIPGPHARVRDDDDDDTWWQKVSRVGRFEYAGWLVYRAWPHTNDNTHTRSVNL